MVLLPVSPPPSPSLSLSVEEFGRSTDRMLLCSPLGSAGGDGRGVKGGRGPFPEGCRDLTGPLPSPRQARPRAQATSST